jgi:predicted Zn-dependent peptidase
MKKTFKKEEKKFNFLSLPSTNYFKIEVVNRYGSNIERVYEKITGKKVYGISHLIEHLAFKSSKDFTTEEIVEINKSKGISNAGTTYDYIDYHFETTSENIDLAIKFICNIAFNDFSNISKKEFEIEKGVVYNEAKRYADDDQTMFYYNTGAVAAGYHEEDNVIGIPETIKTFTLEDAKAIKNIFINNDDITFNICYDPMFLSQNQILAKIETELKRFCVEPNQTSFSKELYTQMLKMPRDGIFKVDNESEQAMNMFLISLPSDTITMDIVSKYLEVFAPETSLNDIIREKHGLTYGIETFIDTFAHKPYLFIACDVSKEDEEQYLKLFNESINASVYNFNKEKYDECINSIKLKRVLSQLNLRAFENLFSIDKIDSNSLIPYLNALSEDIEKGYEMMYEQVSFEVMQENLLILQKAINENRYARLSNV